MGVKGTDAFLFGQFLCSALEVGFDCAAEWDGIGEVDQAATVGFDVS